MPESTPEQEPGSIIQNPQQAPQPEEGGPVFWTSIRFAAEGSPAGAPAGNQADPEDSTQIHQIVERFEEAWQRGWAPTIDAFLPVPGAERHAALLQLVQVDLEYRLKAGEAARVEHYLVRFTEIAENAQAVLALVTVEWEQRRRREPGLRIDEYLRRFPALEEELRGRQRYEEGGECSEIATQVQSPEKAAVAAAASTAPSALDIAGYRILGEIGRGGMGVVYKAQQLSLNRIVAVKMLLTGVHAGTDQLARFRLEAEAVARLQHPNIVSIYEVGQQEGRPFCVLEFMAEGSLDKKLAGQPQEPRQAAQLLETLARAMEAAHQQGIIHRDLKPANILLQRNPKSQIPNPKAKPRERDRISDFGL